MYSLMETFKQCKIIPGWSLSPARDDQRSNVNQIEISDIALQPHLLTVESCLVSDELLQYRHFTSKQQFDKDLTDEQEEEVLAQFAALDPEKKGQIEWSDFLYFESLAVLRKLRTEVMPLRDRRC